MEIRELRRGDEEGGERKEGRGKRRHVEEKERARARGMNEE